MDTRKDLPLIFAHSTGESDFLLDGFRRPKTARIACGET
ncbi:Hypothetical protein CpOVID04_1342 [Corynebacterium pseudotuberculosis]|nr:hypothetical protein CpPA04_1326 [Corynebacterium pseudotuberculosis]QBG77513.1 Hypothetical protein CpCAP1R_1325 [Corynebacterium pseudotuberculosis]QBI73227.1 Hypothetical protein Cp38MAT_1337 [Corynebacterium pseudotuberculosis]QBK60743.1 Hypothetical protein CpE7_1341 [Corynebacterium pseudotuberculosis]QBS29599.1 Hypothetical protein CpCAP1C_1338 [Corynebacterium pseudotuberculosis]